jgi:hypothetical protein
MVRDPKRTMKWFRRMNKVVGRKMKAKSQCMMMLTRKKEKKRKSTLTPILRPKGKRLSVIY